MPDQENGQQNDIQTRVAFAGQVTFLSPEWYSLMPVVSDLLGVEVNGDQDRMVGLIQVARLAGVAPGTPIQWRQRTRRGELTGEKAFPEPDDEDTFPDKPMWRLSTVLNYLLRAKKWPLGAAGRPLERKANEPARAATARVAAALRA